MPKIVTPAHNIPNAVYQWETEQAVYDVGVGATYHRRLVVRDGNSALVGAAGPLVASRVAWADLPANIRTAFTLAAGHGDTL